MLHQYGLTTEGRSIIQLNFDQISYLATRVLYQESRMGSECGGFSFDLCKRNAFLEKKGVPGVRAWKTGTTIAGVVYKVRASACLAGITAHH